MNVLELRTVYFGVDDDVLIIAIDPHNLGARLPIRGERGEGGKISSRGQLPYFLAKHLIPSYLTLTLESSSA
ncbi:hypothetical protein ADILRU_1509 [Leifsonia rubra CMS 76R]|nr:hypothetical protein ADILRU_1509 [Leifsonia rubra CMS 76R]